MRPWRRFGIDGLNAGKILRSDREIDDHIHGVHEADRDLNVGHRLAVDEIDQAIFGPNDPVVVEFALGVRDREVESACMDLAGLRDPPMCDS